MKQLGQLQASIDKFTNHGAKIVALVSDPADKNAEVHKKLSLGFPILSDPTLATIRAYGLEQVGKDISLPATLIVDKGGVVRYRYVGGNPKDRPALEDILAGLSSLGGS